MSDEHVFSIDGHVYKTTQHPPSEGYSIVVHLLSLAADPLASTLGPAVQGVLDALAGSESALDIDAGKLAAAVDAIDWSVVGPAMQRAIPMLSLPIVRQVLRYTWRDDRNLADDAAFDAAFARNYTELFRAVYEVIRFNGFFPLLDTFATAARAAKSIATSRPSSDAPAALA